MTNTGIWEKRVSEWRASGLTSSAYSEGKSFTAGGLRHWAHRVRQQRGRKAGEAAVRIGRVVRAPAPACLAERPAGPEVVGAGERVTSAAASEALVVELGAARVMVRPGFNQATLAAVLEVLAARGGAR